MTSTPSEKELLGTYLDDQPAGATAGTELIRAEAHRPEGESLRRLATEVVEDRQALLDGGETEPCEANRHVFDRSRSAE